MQKISNTFFNVLNKILSKINNLFTEKYAIKSYSQEGEDMILRRIFSDKKNGFYVDIGAHHPKRFSNTYYFYKAGWVGINIEPNKQLIQLFKKIRNKDLNLQLAVSDVEGVLEYYHFNDPALNTFDRELMLNRLENKCYKVVEVEDICVERLDGILGKYLNKNQIIDFMSIDVEGLDFNVLKSNNWRSFRPKCVLVEVFNKSIEDVVGSDIYAFMIEKEYKLFSKTHNTLFFVRAEDE